MFELIGLAIGGFLGFMVADFLAPLDPVRQTIRQALAVGREKLLQLVGSHGSNNPLVSIGILVVVVVIAFWILGFSSAMLLGLVLGVVYKEEIGNLPFVSGLADTVTATIKSKLSGPK